TVDANPGYGITSLVLSEFGDYTLMGLGTAATSANVGTAFFVQITEVDSVTLTDPVTVPFTGSFVPSGGTFELPGDAGMAIPWFGELSIDIDALVAEYQLGEMATRLQVVSNNTLATTSETGTVGFIAKKDYTIGAVNQVVSEPASLTLIGAMGLLAMRRRRA